MLDKALGAIAQSGARPSRAAAELAQDLVVLADMLVTWQKVQNLVSRDTLPALWNRHIADSLQLLPLIPGGATRFVDLGSGGGFPALPMAIALKGSDAQFVLVESNGRKVAFLRAVTRALGLAVTVVDKRIEELVSRETRGVDVVTARALAPLSRLCGYVAPLWGAETVALFAKGREHVEEITESDVLWLHDVIVSPSVVDPEGVILQVRNLRSRSDT